MAHLTSSSPALSSHLLNHTTAHSWASPLPRHSSSFGSGLAQLKASSPLLTPTLPASGSSSLSLSSARPAIHLPSHGTRGGGNRAASASVVSVVSMANVNEGKGLLAPVVVTARRVIGPQRFFQLRGRAIQAHAKAIGGFCDSVRATPLQRQGLIRLAKKNAEGLGFLA